MAFPAFPAALSPGPPNLTFPTNETEVGSVMLADPDIVFAESGPDFSIYYEGNIELLTKPWIKEPHFVPTMAVYSSAFLIGVIGNSLVIFAMLGDRKSRSVTSSFMVSLAVADLLYLAVCVPFETSRYFIGHWQVGSILCKLSGYVEMLTALASILSLTAVSIERYIVIVHPMKARSWCTLGNSKKILPIVWVAALALSAPTCHVMATEHNVYYNNVSSVTLILCADVGIDNADRLVFSAYQFAVMFAAPTLIMVICYAFVIQVLRLSSKQLVNLTSPQSNGKSEESEEELTKRLTGATDTPSRHSHLRCRRSMVNRATREHSAEVLRARKQVIKMLITIIMVFLLCWGPKLIFRVLQRLPYGLLPHFYTPGAFTAKIVLDCLPYVQSCLNPIIYGFMSRNFRKSMKLACSTIVCRRKDTSSCIGRRLLGSDYELDMRTPNGTIQTKISLRTRSSSSDESPMTAVS